MSGSLRIHIYLVFYAYNPDFSPVFGFSGRTVRSGPDFKTLEGMLNSGANHNFVADRMVQRLSLKVSKCPSKIKAINSKEKPVLGIAYGVKFKVG